MAALSPSDQKIVWPSNAMPAFFDLEKMHTNVHHTHLSIMKRLLEVTVLKPQDFNWIVQLVYQPP